MALYDEFQPIPNRLLESRSAYLLSAAYQPVGWYEYSAEAFAEARRQQKPILLDIGASWCHWCHVMDRESYEDHEIATEINELFIPIKVDRDERPDIDSRYQAAVQSLTGQGGWPLTVFLTPDGEPFYGGTYFPPDDIPGHVGMRELLPRIADAFKDHAPELTETAHALSQRAQQATIGTVQAAGPVNEETEERLAHHIRQRFNAEEGGFERAAPKFPHPGAIEFALIQLEHTGGDAFWRAVVERTLTAMGEGGIYDQLGEGFHRYATDDAWIVPHFEKMGYENALLLENYLHAYRATGNLFFREIAGGILDFLLRDFLDRKHGGFYYAQDADNSRHDDGSYWTWTLREFAEILTPEEAAVLTQYYGVRRIGNMPDMEHNVLHIAHTPEQIAGKQEISLEEVWQRIEHGISKLLTVRERRKAPRINTDKYAGWNALLISSFIEAGALIGREDATQMAMHALETILHDAYDDDHGIYHQFQTAEGAILPGMLDDQVYTARALLDAHAVNGNYGYVEIARHLMDLCLEHYWDENGGGFLDVERARQQTAITPILRKPRKVIDDMPTPAANAVAVMVLDRLWAITGEERYRSYAQRTLETFASYAPEYGPFAGYYGAALHHHLHPPVTVVITGHPEAADTRLLAKAAMETYRPGRQVAIFSPDGTQKEYPPSPSGEAIAYVCADRTCTAPTSEVEELRERMMTIGKG